jgi:hypothetical protein
VKGKIVDWLLEIFRDGTVFWTRESFREISLRQKESMY